MFDKSKLSCVVGSAESQHPRTWNYYSSDDISVPGYFDDATEFRPGDKITSISTTQTTDKIERVETPYVLDFIDDKWVVFRVDIDHGATVNSVNGQSGDVILTGDDINATIQKSTVNGPEQVTEPITSHLQNLSDYTMTLQGEIDTNAGKTAELDADVQKKVDKSQGADNAGKVLMVNSEGDVEAVEFSPLPNQSGHSGVLQTNGTTPSWNDYIKVSSNSILLTNTAQPAINGQIVIGKDAGGVGNSGVDNVILGNRGAAANYGIAIGADAKAQAESSIQIGAGTNTEAGTFCVSTGTYPNQKNVTLLDNKGNVPSARITDSFNQALSDTNLGATMADIKTVSDQVTVIEKEIPAAASETNQLADKAFVNSSINNMAAFYITSDTDGDAFATKAALDAGPWYFDGTERTPTLNDYAIVLKDESHDNKTTRYSYTGSQWSFQYVVNNTELTQAQINAMNSGITTTKVTSYDNHIANKENPHEVTKAQVGLGNVDNTSDADKPISTATQAALNNKIGTDQVNQTISTTNKVATLLDIEGLRGDYCSRYGVTASPNGRVRIGTGNQMIVPAGLQLTIPGADGEPVAPLVTLASQVTVPTTLTSDCVFAYVAGLDQPFQFCDKVCFSLIQPADDESTCQLWFDGKGWHFRSINEGNVWVNVRAHVLAECIFTGGNLTRLNTNGWYHDMYSKLGDIETLLATI